MSTSLPAVAQAPGGTEMCGNGNTFSVQLPGLDGVLPGGRRAPNDSIKLPDGCSIYALLVSGYARNTRLDELTFYKLAKFVAEHDGYVHYAWWNNLISEYLAGPLHDVLVDLGPLGIFRSNPGDLGNVHGLGFVPRDRSRAVDLVPKAIPEEDLQFQADAERFLRAIRDRNPQALIIVAGHSMGGNSVARLGANPRVTIDLLAPIDPVGNRTRPVGEVDATYNWNRWRVANELHGFRQRDCVRNALGLCRDFDPRPFHVRFECEEGPLLDRRPLVDSRAPHICPAVRPVISSRPRIGANVRHLYHRWQKEFLFPFDFTSDERLVRSGPVSGPLGPNHQTPVKRNLTTNPVRDETCGLLGSLDIHFVSLQVIGGSFPPLPIAVIQPGDPRDPSIICDPFDGHGEIVGFRKFVQASGDPIPYGLTAQVWPCSAALSNPPLLPGSCLPGGGTAANRRQKLIEMVTAPSPDPHKVLGDPPAWIHEPLNPNLDMVVDDLVAITQHLLDLRRLPPSTDVTPPVSTASLALAANENGWHSEDVQVTVVALDEPGGSGVGEIELRLDPPGGPGTTQPGDTAEVSITTEGTTELTYYARDLKGNEEMANFLSVRLDKTAPQISAVASPAANSAGWNRTDVTVSFAAQDAVSGVDTVDPPVTLSDEGVDLEALGRATDLAGNSSALTLLVSIDKTAPEIHGLPGPDCRLWPPDGRLVQVATLTATDALAGVADGSLIIDVQSSEADRPRGGSRGTPDFVISGGDVWLQAERTGGGRGRTYHLTATVLDRADNATTRSAACTVPHDQRRRR